MSMDKTVQDVVIQPIVQRLTDDMDVLTAAMPLAGRLGNEMFLYASLYGMSHRFNRTIGFRDKSELFEHFNLSAVPVSITQSGWIIQKEKFANIHDSALEHLVNKTHGKVRLIGYFQSYKYFDHCRESLLRELHFRPNVQSRIHSFLLGTKQNQSTDTQPTFIGVHIRRGDMASDYSFRRGYTVASKTYLDKAVKFYKELFSDKNIVFIVITDDETWSKKNFDPAGSHCVYSIFRKEPIVDLALLSSCNHTIMTVGSYGWWGAYLANGKTVYYNNFPRPGSVIDKGFNKRDYFLPGWVGLR